MRRRSKRGPNTSESTGKIGQELPQNQLAPLQPSYSGGPPPDAQEHYPEPAPLSKAAKPVAAKASAEVAAAPVRALEAAAEPVGKMVVETQPELLSTPPPEPLAGAKGGLADLWC